MLNDLFWIPIPFPGRLAIMARPRGGDWLNDEVRAWRRTGVDVMVSLLTAEEASALDLTAEAEHCQAADIRFETFPIDDRDVPTSRTEFAEFVRRLTDDLTAGRSVAVHCRQGIGRAGLVAVAILLRTGLDPDNAIAQVTVARGRPVPETPEQYRWLIALDSPRKVPAA